MKLLWLGIEMRFVDIRTELPGPKSRALMAKRQKVVARGPFHATPLFIAKAEGAMIEDVDGNRFIDLASGIGVTNVGHRASRVMEAIAAQGGLFLHSAFNVMPYDLYLRLAEKLNEKTPGHFPKKTFLANSGAEAVENAIKIARAYTSRPAVICFDHAFHGRTYMAMSLTSKYKPYKFGFEPFASEIYRSPFPYAYRSESSDPLEVSNESFRAFEKLVHERLSPDRVAAVIIEPVLGEGGFIPAPAEFLQRLQRFCHEHKIVFIADEIQTGFGRTGNFFACDTLGVVPDLVLTAKGLGGGLPISAVTGRAEIMDATIEGGIGGTFGGNPLACASALAVFEIFENDGLLAHSRKLAEALGTRLKDWRERKSSVGDARGLGAMQAIEFVKSKAGKEPFAEAAKFLQKYSYENGVISMTAGTYGNVIRFLMPLVITEEQLHEALDILETGLNKLNV